MASLPCLQRRCLKRGVTRVPGTGVSALHGDRRDKARPRWDIGYPKWRGGAGRSGSTDLASQVQLDNGFRGSTGARLDQEARRRALSVPAHGTRRARWACWPRGCPARRGRGREDAGLRVEIVGGAEETRRCRLRKKLCAPRSAASARRQRAAARTCAGRPSAADELWARELPRGMCVCPSQWESVAPTIVQGGASRLPVVGTKASTAVRSRFLITAPMRSIVPGRPGTCSTARS